MAKLTEYPQATTFDEGDILIKDGTNGTKKILVSDALADMMQNKEDIEHLKKATISVFSTDAILLDSAYPIDDLNDLEPGEYRTGTTADAARLKNSPSTTGYRLIVLETTAVHTSSVPRIIQIAFINSTGAAHRKIAFRVRVTNTWSDWDYVISESKVNKHMNSLGILPVNWENGRLSATGADVTSIYEDKNYAIRTGYREVNPGDVFHKWAVTGKSYGSYFYDSDKVFIDGSRSTDPDVTAPANAAYVRFAVALNQGEIIDAAKDSKDFLILRSTGYLNSNIGNSPLFSGRINNRSFNISLPVNIDDIFIVIPLEWNGPEASSFTVYAINDGSATTIGTVQALNDYAIIKANTSGQSLRIGINSVAFSEYYDIKCIVMKLGRDNFAPLAYSLGKEIDSLKSQIAEISSRLDS